MSLRGTVEGCTVLPRHPVSLRGAVYAEHISLSSLSEKLIRNLLLPQKASFSFLFAHVNTEPLLNANVGDILLLCQVEKLPRAGWQ